MLGPVSYLAASSWNISYVLGGLTENAYVYEFTSGLLNDGLTWTVYISRSEERRVGKECVP